MSSCRFLHRTFLNDFPPMKITKVCCQGCGATLDVDESIRYVTCNHCASRLEVVHDPSITHTKVLEKIERATDHLAEEVRVLKLQNEVAQLDREWSIYRESMLSRSKDGSVSEPSTSGSLLGGLVVVIGGTIWTIMATAMTGFAARVSSFGFIVGLFPLFGVLFVGLGLYHIFAGMAKASSYNKMRESYETRRQELLRKRERSASSGYAR